MKNKLVIVVFVCMVCSLSQGAVIVEYNFGADLAATTEGANVTASDIGLSSGLGSLAGRSGTAGGCLYARSSATGLTDLAGAITDIDYFTFTIDVAAGYEMDLTSMTLEQGYTRNSSFTGKFLTANLLTSVDGFTSADSVSDITSFATINDGGMTPHYQSWTIDSQFSGVEFQGLTGSTEFRFYLTDNTDSADIIHRFDDIVLNGTVGVIPDPNRAHITEDPVGQTVVAGTEVTLSVTAENATEYGWYKDGVEIVGSDSNSLVLTNVQLTDEADYHCEAYNAFYPYPNAHVDAISATVRVMTKRLAGWWKLDGDLTDSVATVETGAPTHDGFSFTEPNYVTTALIGGGLEFSGDPDQLVGIMGDPNFFNFYPQGYTVSAWIRTTSSTWGAYVAKSTAAGVDGPGRRGFLLNTNGGAAIHSLRQSGIGSDENLSSGVDITDGESWHLITGSYDGTTGLVKIYVDGLLANSETGTGVPEGNTAPLVFGSAYFDGSATKYIGSLDDVAIYTYPRTPEEIADEYLAVMTEIDALCIYPDFFGVEFDVAGGPVDGEGNPTPDCQVSLPDFAELAGVWLASGLHPAP